MSRRKSPKTCKMCDVELTPINSYYSGHYRLAYCKSCSKIRSFQRDSSDDTLKTRYNISLEDYNRLSELQSHGCAICKQKCKTNQRLSVDHNHKTNEIRGLLCRHCNRILGFLREDEDYIWNILEYLKRTTWNKKKEVA